MKTFIEYIHATLYLAGILTGIYLLPYLLRKGWIDGESSSVQRKKICDMCFKDIDRYNKWKKDNNL